MEDDIIEKENKDINVIISDVDQGMNIDNNGMKNNNNDSSLVLLEKMKNIHSLIKKESSNKKICKYNFK